MKRHVLTAFLIISAVLFVGFTSAPDERSAVKDLVCKRAFILQDAYFKRITQAEANSRLAQIETASLLLEDVSGLSSASWCDMDVVKDITFIEVTRLDGEVVDGEQMYRARVLWLMYGMQGDYSLECVYDIKTLKTGGKTKLSKMTAAST